MLNFNFRSAVYALSTVLFLASNISLAASALDEIKDAKGKKTVLDGGQYHVTHSKTGEPWESPWPEVISYQLVRAQPEEAMAIFSDYESQTYVPRVLEVKAKRISNLVDEVSYTMEVPVYNETYTVKDHIEQYKAEAGKSYKMYWTFVRADTLKHIDGDVRFEAYGNETLMVYRNFVVPTRLMSGWPIVVDSAVNGMLETATKIKERIQTEANAKGASYQKNMEEFKKRGLQ